jgi:hypothetical protein
MRRNLIAAVVASSSWALLTADVAGAQVYCPQGKTAGGQCVNAVLAQSMQQSANILAQPKLSETAYPVLPSADAQYRYPNQLNPSPLKPALTTGPTP